MKAVVREFVRLEGRKETGLNLSEFKSYVRRGSQKVFLGGDMADWEMLSEVRIHENFYCMGHKNGSSGCYNNVLGDISETGSGCNGLVTRRHLCVTESAATYALIRIDSYPCVLGWVLQGHSLLFHMQNKRASDPWYAQEQVCSSDSSWRLW